MHRTLITGADGFVGRHLCAEWSQQGYQVRATTRSHNRLSATGETVMVGSIDARTKWANALCNVDTLIHLAARVHVIKDKTADPLTEFLKVNLHGTSNLAQQAANSGVRRLIYVSSIKVNGEQTTAVRPFVETDEPNPQDPYGISKWRAEQELQRISQETGLEVVIVRPPLIYGPGVKGNLARLLSWVEHGVPLPLTGIRNTRSLIGIDNFTSVLHACLTHPAAAGRTYLVRDGEDISTPELLRRLGHHLDKPARLFTLPPPLLERLAGWVGRRADAQRLTGSLIVDDSRIRRELGWVPPRTLDEGLALMTRAWLNSAG